MTDFTKKVTVNYSSDADQTGATSEPFMSARWAKMDELKLAGKTDGAPVITPPTSVIMFVDQESAEEYLDLVISAAAEGNVGIESSSITDV